ncbi:hypothetical protein Tco_0820742 [Tanacetum coccineum]|uniref:Uncharacterized protein n=1 Tax=Tanacetum coccineum TaxID=301880 RepID=A0ABQ5AB76_9ASTR
MAAIHDSPTPNLTISFRGCLLQPKPPQSGVRFGQPPYKGGCLGDQPTKKGPFGSGGKQPPQGVFVMAVINNGVFVWVSKKCKGPFGLADTQPQGVFASGSQQPGACSSQQHVFAATQMVFMTFTK